MFEKLKKKGKKTHAIIQKLECRPYPSMEKADTANKISAKSKKIQKESTKDKRQARLQSIFGDTQLPFQSVDALSDDPYHRHESGITQRSPSVCANDCASMQSLNPLTHTTASSPVSDRNDSMIDLISNIENARRYQDMNEHPVPQGSPRDTICLTKEIGRSTNSHEWTADHDNFILGLERIQSTLSEQLKHESGLTEAQINNFCTFRVFKGMLDKHGHLPECSICFDILKEGQMAKELPCKHIYHKKCIDVWLKSNAICPLDKTSLKQLLGQPTTSLFCNQARDQNYGRLICLQARFS
eukprot:TRINITY_DN4618_c0_g1_i5.p1 TRINITY_DN4618_c0_g1~~TRINITY_DN4618_c0_g1_i5.p1  ORF type:complete len:299 (+),score=6.88 TRINITY_DN4618_c0_g1_i5:143-1039(+)